MFAGWFSRTLPSEDRVWRDASACTTGLQRDVAHALDDGHAVLLLLRSTVDLKDTARALQDRAPAVFDQAHVTADLPRHLAARGALAMTIATAQCPRPEEGHVAGRRSAAPLQVHVRGRGDRRRDDRELLDALKGWAPQLVVFHHGLDDRLLRDHTATLRPMLERLGIGADESVASALIGRAIARVQQP